MSWDDFHRRNRAITAVLEHARRTGQTTLQLDLPEVAGVFSGAEELVKALHYKWSLLVTAHMDYDIFEDGIEPAQAARHAEQLAAAEAPMLRELLDANEHTTDLNSMEARYLAMARAAVQPSAIRA